MDEASLAGSERPAHPLAWSASVSAVPSSQHVHLTVQRPIDGLASCKCTTGSPLQPTNIKEFAATRVYWDGASWDSWQINVLGAADNMRTYHKALVRSSAESGPSWMQAGVHHGGAIPATRAQLLAQTFAWHRLAGATTANWNRGTGAARRLQHRLPTGLARACSCARRLRRA